MKSILTVVGFVLLFLAIVLAASGDFGASGSLLAGAIGCGVGYAIVDRLDLIHAALIAKSPASATAQREEDRPEATRAPTGDIEEAKRAMRAALKP